jgi:hypothetical protein
MSDQGRTRTTLTKQEGRNIAGYQGSEAGKDVKYREAELQRMRQEYDSEMGWAGLGNVAKKPKGSVYEEGFQAWLKKKKTPPVAAPAKPKAKVSSEEAAEALEKRKE